MVYIYNYIIPSPNGRVQAIAMCLPVLPVESDLNRGLNFGRIDCVTRPVSHSYEVCGRPIDMAHKLSKLLWIRTLGNRIGRERLMYLLYNVYYLYGTIRLPPKNTKQ